MAGNGEIERREYRVTCKDGTVKTMVIFGVLVSGKVFVMFEDITALKQAAEERLSLERQLLHAQKLESLGILAGGIAHDFNNLLTAILGNADLALAELPPPSPARPLVEQIQTASLRAAELTRQMLVFAGRGELATVPLELSATVREMGQLLAASLSKKAELRLDLAEDLPPIEADPAQLRQIIMNFILNASDAIGEQPGVIAVRTGRDGHDRSFAPDFSDRHAASGARRRLPGSRGHRLRHRRRHAPAHLRPLLHDEVHRARTRAGGDAGDHPAPQRRAAGAKPPRRGLGVPRRLPRPAAARRGSRAGGRDRPATAPPRHAPRPPSAPGGAAASSCSSTTRRPCAR